MRSHHRKDDNEDDVVKALEAIGCTVYRSGRPTDLIAGYRGRNYLIECKNKDGLNKLTKFQKQWIPSWKGQVRIVHTPEEAIELVTNAYRL